MTNHTPGPFAQRIRRKRMALGLTQRDIGDRVGLTSRAVCEIEAGSLRPGIRVAARLAFALDVTCDVKDIWTSPPPMKKGAKRTSNLTA